MNVTPPPLPVPLNAHLSLYAVSARLGQTVTLNVASVALQTFGRLGNHVGLIVFQRPGVVSQGLQGYVPLRQPHAMPSGPARVLKAALSWLKGVNTGADLQSAEWRPN